MRLNENSSSAAAEKISDWSDDMTFFSRFHRSRVLRATNHILPPHLWAVIRWIGPKRRPMSGMQRNVREASCPKRQGVIADALSRGDPTGRITNIGFIFQISKVNGAHYFGDQLPSQAWKWPDGTWFQSRLKIINEYNKPGAERDR